MSGPAPRVVSFPGAAATLRGHLYVPAGRGPFPAVVWSHGSERDPDERRALGQFWTLAGYVLFAPHRSGHGLSPGDYPIDALQSKAAAHPKGTAAYRREIAALVIDLHERQLADTLSAVRWIEGQPFVDARRIVVSGVSHGATQTLLAAGAGAGVRAGVPFAPAAMAWSSGPELREWLVDAVRRVRVPLFLLQAENDFDLGPSEVLGAELERRGPPSRARVYPAYGQSPEEGHAGFACEASGVWGADVLAFVRAASEA